MATILGPAATTEEAPSDAPMLRVTRELPHPRFRVWAAWTDPTRVGRWWGPHGFTTTTSAHDLRPGGEWRFVMHGPDGTDYVNRVVYRTVEPPALLAYGHYGPNDPEDRPHFEARVDFAETPGGTRVTLTMRFPDMAARTAALDYGAVEGGRQTLARFAALLDAG